MFQFVINFLDLFFKRNQGIIGFVGIKFSDSHHFDFQQLQDILTYNFPDEILFKRLKSGINMTYHSVLTGTFFKPFVLINPVLDEYFFQRSKKELLQQFFLLNFEFHLQKIFGMLATHPQHIADIHETGFLIMNDTTIRRNAHLTIGKSIQSIYRFIGRRTRLQVYQNFNICRGIIIYFSDFNFPFFRSPDDRFYHLSRI